MYQPGKADTNNDFNHFFQKQACATFLNNKIG
jgi:hypothetical protein